MPVIPLRNLVLQLPLEQKASVTSWPVGSCCCRQSSIRFLPSCVSDDAPLRLLSLRSSIASPLPFNGFPTLLIILLSLSFSTRLIFQWEALRDWPDGYRGALLMSRALPLNQRNWGLSENRWVSAIPTVAFGSRGQASFDLLGVLPLSEVPLWEPERSRQKDFWSRCYGPGFSSVVVIAK